MTKRSPITVAKGDGIGPEIMDATLHILQEAGAELEIQEIEAGEKVYRRGSSVGIEPAAWESLRRTRVFLKAPLTTPQGGGFKSLNVTTRKMLGLYANIRPCVAYAPYIDTIHPNMNVVIVRENEEDTYVGIEHRQSRDITQCLKLISRPGSERIVRYAFEYAVRNNRRKVTCFTKDNIMKLTDGLFHRVFDEISPEFPSIEKEHMIVDMGAARLADTPEDFDVIVMPNLYGDILSDVAAQIAGSVGLAPSANIGVDFAMFEAIHGSAPRRAGQDLANPSGLLLSAVMMLVHLDQPEAAARVHNAWLKTIEDGIHTYDIYTDEHSTRKAGTREFAQSVAARLGQLPETLASVSYREAPAAGPAARTGDDAKSRHRAATARERSPVLPNRVLNRAVALPNGTPEKKEMVGIDLFLDWTAGTANQLGAALEPLAGPDLHLVMIYNRGVRVYPGGFPDTLTCDTWRCRFMSPDGEPVSHAQIIALLQRVDKAGYDFVKFESLCNFDGKPGFSLGQGQ